MWHISEYSGTHVLGHLVKLEITAQRSQLLVNHPEVFGKQL